MDWCSPYRTEYIDASCITTIWGNSIRSLCFFCFSKIFGFHSSSINDHTHTFFCLQVRKLEFLIAFLVLTIAGCFFAELGYAKPAATEVLDGLFVPQLKGNGATGLAISLLGAMVMP